jgi:hypothetical protein
MGATRSIPLGVSGGTFYAQVRSAAGQVWNTSGAAFEAYNAGNVTDYDLALTEQGGSGVYTFDLPAGIGAGFFSVIVFERAGGSPAEGDAPVWEETLGFDGTDIADHSRVASLASGVISSTTFATNAIDSGVLATTAVTEIRNAITGGSYALDTDASGRVRLVIGTGTGEISITAGHVDADVAKIDGSAAAAVRLALSAGMMIPFTVNAANTTPTSAEIACDDLSEATADHYKGRLALFTTGALAGQVVDVTGYTYDAGNSEGILALSGATEAPADNDTGILI